jgi:sporulation protein YlmC with PRC-barrel domain
MKIELGAKVITADGKETGTIDKLILDPDSGDIHAVVVRKGLLSGRDVEVPVDGIVGQDAGAARLRFTEAQLDEQPRFYEDSYTTPPPERSAEYASGYGYPAASLLWPSRWSGPIAGEPYGHEAVGAVGDEVAAMHREQDLNNSVIEAGSEVRSRDGEKVGEVHRVAFDPTTGRPSMLVIRKGFLFTEDVEVPADLILSVGDEAIYLDAPKDELERSLKRPAEHPAR